MKKEGNKTKRDFVPAVSVSDIDKATLDFARRIIEGSGVSGVRPRRVEVDVERIDRKLWERRQELARKLREKYMEQFDDEESRELQFISAKLAKALNSAMSAKEEKESENVR